MFALDSPRFVFGRQWRQILGKIEQELEALSRLQFGKLVDDPVELFRCGGHLHSVAKIADGSAIPVD